MLQTRKFIIFVSLVLDVVCALRWNASGYRNHEDSTISLKMTKTELKIDAPIEKEIVILKDIPFYYMDITINCFVVGYNNHMKLSYFFCKDYDCSGPYNDGGHRRTVSFHRMTIIIKTKFSNRNGIQLKLTLPLDGQDSSGNFYCKAEDNVGHFSIRSNNIQIRDKMYWEQKSVTNNHNLKTKKIPLVRKKDLPITFPCLNAGLPMNTALPNWFYQEFSSPVFWEICPVRTGKTLIAVDKVTFSKCVRYTSTIWPEQDTTLKPRHIWDMPWEYYVNEKGELTIFDFHHEFKPSDLTFALMCYIKGSNSIIPINTFVAEYNNDYIIKGVVFDLSMPIDPVQLKPISPEVQYVNIFARTVPRYLKGEKIQKITIFAKYKASAKASAFWFYRGNQIRDDLSIISNRFKLEFVSDITLGMSGNYDLRIKDNGNMLEMKIIVTVLGSPVLMNQNCLPLVRHVWEYDNTSFVCNYTSRVNELKILINKAKIELHNQRYSANINLRQEYPYLADLNFNITRTNYSTVDIDTMSYAIFKLRKSQGQIKYQDHTITFFASNSYGSSVRSSSIYTVPKVRDQILVFPESSNCVEDCKSSDSHIFLCRFNSDEYANKELNVDQFWTINGHRLDQLNKTDNWLAPFFEMDEKTKDLELLPINSSDMKINKLVKEALRFNFIICHINLYSTVESKSSFNYFSYNDPSLKDRLKSKIMLDYQPLNLAFAYWTASGILIIVLLIVGIFIWHRWIQNVSDTYPIEKLEIKYGIDVAKELENERIPSYHHEENQSDWRFSGSTHTLDSRGYVQN